MEQQYPYQFQKPKKKFNWGWIIFYGIIALGLIIGGTTLYQKLDKPVAVEIQKYANLNIKTFFKTEPIETGIIIQENGVEILNTITKKNSYTSIRVNYNNSLSISTYNLEDQSYIIKDQKIEVSSPIPKLINLRLDQRPQIEVEEKVKGINIYLKVKGVQDDFGDLSLFYRARGVVIINTDVNFERYDTIISNELEYDRGYDITENLQADETVTIRLPYVAIGQSNQFEYCLSGLQHNNILGYELVGGYCNIIEL